MEDPEETTDGLNPSIMETLAGDKAALVAPGAHRILLKPRRSDPEFPVEEWDRYSFVRFLGQGGMGKVFLARDKRLGREVAIKFVRVDDERYLSRFMAEARTQARVDHPHVCKVFEVGEVEGKIFIAMQHIKGLPLDVAALQLTLEQKVMVIRDAALGVHEAHRMGIIHRDLKPSNILVEQDEDGVDHAYVMDFGLAHEWNTESTETGSVLGTPAFMSPEQARGEVSRLDRRADVYSLGATLYQAITGQAAVEGSNPLEILSAVSSADPKPFRALKLDIPRDLEAITLKCLEKDRRNRYDSAKALAEDLDRFLAGDPVQARPTGIWYRLQRKARKNKQLTAVILVACGLVLIAGGMALRANRNADRREILARRFTEAMARLESMSRYSALSPAHDIRPDLQAVRDQMTRLREDMAASGRLADGPGHYALGWGYWTLDDGEQAREHLQMAWDAGYQEPRVAYALSLAVGQLYRDQLLEAQRVSAPMLREARLKEVAATLREPALRYLRLAQGADVPSPRFLEAQLAFYEGRLDEALAQLQALGSAQPWFFEAPLLRGSLLQARAWEKWNRGDREGAQADFDAGRTALTQAATVARSAPSVHAALGELEYNILIMEKYGQGRVPEAAARGLAAIGSGLALHPDHVPTLIEASAIQSNLADFQASRGEDSEALAQEAVVSADRAVAAGPFRADARIALGRAAYQLGSVRGDQGRDPREALGRGLQAFESLSESKRDASTWTYLGLIHQTWAEFEGGRGEDQTRHLGSAIAAYDRAIALAPQVVPARINQGTCLNQRASLPNAVDPEADLRAAAKVLQEANALNPKHFVPYFVLGKVRWNQALRARARGEDPKALLQETLELNQKGSAINGTVPNMHLGAAAALEELAREQWEQGHDPAATLATAIETNRKSVAVAPKFWLAYANLADRYLAKAELLEDRSALEGAEQAVRKAQALAPDMKEVQATWGHIQLMKAQLTLKGGGDPRRELEAVARFTSQALQTDPTFREALYFQGQAKLLAARWHARQRHADPRDFDEARTRFRRLLEVQPDHQEAALAWAEAAYFEGAEGGRATAHHLQESLDQVERLLKLRPRWAAALALRGGLRFQLALGADPAQRSALAQGAVEDLSKALDLNSHLQSRWGEPLAQARKG